MGKKEAIMIQRIQSIFLILAGGASFGLLGLPFASTDAAAASGLFADGQYTIQDNTVLMILFLAAGLAAVAAVLFYKNRPLQMRVAAIVALVLAVGAGLGAYFYLQDAGHGAVKPAIGAAMPVLGIILALVARRYIGKDEKLVRSMDRLR